MERKASTLATLILPIAKALRLQGVDPMELLEQAGIDPATVINATKFAWYHSSSDGSRLYPVKNASLSLGSMNQWS